MDSIDLLALVKKFGKLDGIELYGYIPSRLNRPINLFDSVKVNSNSFFVKMDVLAVNLQKYSQYLKDFGITNKENNDIYLVNGSVALCVSSSGKYPDWYATRGTLRLGSKSDDSYLTLFAFNKNNNAWSIGENSLYTMEIDSWNRESRLYSSVYRSIENGFITVPDDVAKLPRFYAKQTQGVVLPAQQPNYERPSLSDNLQCSLNGIKPVEILTSSSTFEITNRTKILDEPENLIKLKDTLASVNTSSKNFINTLKYDYSASDCTDDCVKFMVNSLRSNLKSKPHNLASTGRVLLKKYLNLFGEYADTPYLGVTAGQYLIDDFGEVADFILDHSCSVSIDGCAWKLCKRAFLDTDLFYMRMLGIILGVSVDKLESLCYCCREADIDVIKIMNRNPYLLLLISSEFSYQEVDYIAYCLGKSNDKSIEEYKLVGVVFDYLNNSSEGSTVYRLKNIINSKIGVSLTKAKYTQCVQRGTYLSDTLLCNIYYYIDSTIQKSEYVYPNKGWIQNGYNYTLPLTRTEIELGVSLAEKYGIVSKFTLNDEDWLTSSKLLMKELEICKKFYELAKNGSKGYDHTLIDSYIDEYENNVGFKFEKEQREAIHLVDCYVAIITGPAGSGKTTVSDCMVYVLNKLEDNTIEYAAPTGKAAKRLQEVVKKPVQTFNSKFKIFSGSDNLLTEENMLAGNSNTTYFFDEVAMTNVNLFYSVCMHLNECCVYLLGDICQLPPIGKGLPFKNLLRFLPCVKLNVTKRSAENSGITYNSRVINEYSEGSNWQNLKEASDFKIIPCNDDDIKRVTILICKLHLNKITTQEMSELCKLTKKTPEDFLKIPDLSKDDIQVVSPIGKQTYSWGTCQLNNALQSIFNPVREYTKMFKYQLSDSYAGTKFSIGDRVIHTDSNMYSMQWYSEYSDGYFKKTYGFGISNGDVGKIVAFYPSQSCEFEKETGSEPEDFKYPENLRDDSTFISTGNWFIVVEYYDFMSDSNFYILYRASENTSITNSECKAFVGDDLKKLNLFYAGTTHKMQGSQSRLIIGLLGRVNFKGFLSRNMLYTEVTRAQDGVYLIGSVGNERNSQLSIARRCVADDGVDTVQELIYT